MNKGKCFGMVLLTVMALGQMACGDSNLLVRTQTNPYMDEEVVLASSSDTSSANAKDIYFVLDILPGGLLVSPDVDGFAVFDTFRTEIIDGEGSWMPTVKAGVGFNTPDVLWEVTGGSGFIWNNAFSAPTALGDFATRFKLGDWVTLGPHVSLVYFGEADWEGDNHVEFSDATGVIGGLVLTVGKEKFSFSLAVDYLDAAFDVDEGFTNDDELDISGFAVRGGLILRF